MSFLRFRLKFRILTLFPTLYHQFIVGVEVQLARRLGKSVWRELRVSELVGLHNDNLIKRLKTLSCEPKTEV